VKSLETLALVGALGAISVSPANAAIVVNFTQSGPNVVATTSGTLNITGLAYVETDGVSAGIFPRASIFSAVYSVFPYTTNIYSGVFGPAMFCNTGFQSASSSTGDVFYINSRQVGVSQGFASGSALNAVTTFANATFASIGVTPGTYSYILPNDTVTINISNVSAVPEPATWAMMILGMSAVGFAMRRRKNVSTSVKFA
jgi:hypothetical protein